MAGKRETTRVSYYFLKEKKILAMTALSGILYNLGLVAVWRGPASPPPWYSLPFPTFSPSFSYRPCGM